MNKITTLFRQYPAYFGAVAALLYFGFNMWPRSDAAGDFNYREFGRIGAIDGGRYKPLDTVARMNLMVIMHRQQLYDATTGKTYSATKWLLDCMTTPLPRDEVIAKLFDSPGDSAYRYKIFRIENDQVMQMLNLERVEGLRYSVVDIAAEYPKLAQVALNILGDEDRGIPAKDPKTQTLFDAKVVELWQHLNLFMKLAGHGAPLTIPQPDGSDQWRPFREAQIEFGPDYDTGKLADTPETRAYVFYHKILTAYAAGNRNQFNSTLTAYLGELDKAEPARMTKLKTERFFNEFAPFYHCLVIYGLIFVLGLLSWLMPNWMQPMRTALFSAMIVAFVFHTFGLFLRMYLQDRMFVFVTNLYSSAVFIGLGCVAVCLFTEYFYRNGMAIAVGSVTGFCTLIIAHMLSLDGDTMVMMQAVLDTNFWLATHVTCVTLGYTAAFVAGFMGIAYIGLGIFTNMLRKEGSANLARMTYGVLCAGMFLSFVGTVLGGLWADYSWGRFWGWDPKENGALLIVLWIALILHARWGGMIKHRGIAVLSVVGIVITSWSWFGTNFLGVGLHSYGFRQGAMLTLILIDLGFLAIAGLGLLPLHHWQSFCPPSQQTAAGARAKPA